MQHFAQWLVVIWLIVQLVRMIWNVLEGRRYRPPLGFIGVLAALIAAALWTVTLIYAGAFSTFGK